MSSEAALRFIGGHDIVSEGKCLWEILGQLKNFGIGRYVTKNEWLNKWPGQNSFVKILQVRPKMDPWLQRGIVWGHWTYRGHELGIYKFDKDLNRSDWRLIHKHDERALLSKDNNKLGSINMPDSFPLPPLQKLLTKKSTGKNRNRAPLDLCIDPQFKILEQLIVRIKPQKEAQSIYEEFNPEEIVDMYGGILPPKVDSWSTDPANYSYHFHPDNIRNIKLNNFT